MRVFNFACAILSIALVDQSTSIDWQSGPRGFNSAEMCFFEIGPHGRERIIYATAEGCANECVVDMECTNWFYWQEPKDDGEETCVLLYNRNPVYLSEAIDDADKVDDRTTECGIKLDKLAPRDPNGSPAIPAPSPLSCDRVPYVYNGKVVPGDSFIGSSRKVSCDFGYEVQAPEEVFCTITGQWSVPGGCANRDTDSRPRCDSDTLPFRSKSFYGENDTLSYASGSIVKMGCQHDYFVEGNNFVECQDNGLWTNPGECEKLDSIQYPPSTFVPHNALAQELWEAVRESRFDLVKAYIDEEGVNPAVYINTPTGKKREFFRNMPMHEAVMQYNIDIIKELLEFNLQQLRAYDSNCMLPIHAAAETGSPEAMQYLLKHPTCDNCIEWRDCAHERTPLIFAAAAGNLPTVHELLFEGADVYARDANQTGAIHYAALNGHLEVVKALWRHTRGVLELEGGEHYWDAQVYAAKGGAHAIVTWIRGRKNEP